MAEETSKPKSGQVVPLKTASKKRACSACGKPATVQYRPFCSKRCADLDLGQWLGGGYRIPTEERPEPGDFSDVSDETEES